MSIGGELLVTPTSRGAHIEWQFTIKKPLEDKPWWKIKVYKPGKPQRPVFVTDTAKWPYCLQNMEPGHDYGLKVIMTNFDGDNLGELTTEFRTSFSPNQLERLSTRKPFATRSAHVRPRTDAWIPVSTLFLDKTQAFFDDCRMDGKIQRDIGEPTGHDECTVSNSPHATGVWMSCPFRGSMPPTSYFGDRRFVLDLPTFMRRKQMGLFFADFFCTSYDRNAPHLVTLVLCPANSKDYEFCHEKLMWLDRVKNDFFWVKKVDPHDPSRDQYFVHTGVADRNVARCPNAST
ncbi:hypothetical protein M3Y99_00491600 [Aphelenchoides fujianensis]|nr:hypothetical protein M3Y99_00491600 [Aphelenchoides fujianensis]